MIPFGLVGLGQIKLTRGPFTLVPRAETTADPGAIAGLGMAAGKGLTAVLAVTGELIGC